MSLLLLGLATEWPRAAGVRIEWPWRGTDLIRALEFGVPPEVSAKQLRELHIRLILPKKE